MQNALKSFKQLKHAVHVLYYFSKSILHLANSDIKWPAINRWSSALLWNNYWGLCL